MNSSIKLLLIVREPVTRVISDYTQIYLQQNASSSISLQELAMVGANVNTNYKAIRISMYSRYMRRWLDVFPKVTTKYYLKYYVVMAKYCVAMAKYCVAMAKYCVVMVKIPVSMCKIPVAMAKNPLPWLNIALPWQKYPLPWLKTRFHV